MEKSSHRREFGDFQTPTDMARRICRFLFEQGVRPSSIVEPTCGEGNLLLSALDRFSSATKAIGIDVNPEYIERVKNRLVTQSYSHKARVFQGNFFDLDWGQTFDNLPDPVLVIGNPPWVTSSELASLNSANLPKKTNFQGLSGLDAKTGKSNFDISEWMLIHILELLEHRDATMAMLCKTSVARKVLSYTWKRNLGLRRSQLYLIDAKKVFDASVDACLLVCDVSTDERRDQVCHVYDGLSSEMHQSTFGYRNNRLIASIERYERWKHLEGDGNFYKWRSGIKHDCSKVMELEKEKHGFRNKLGELCDLEAAYIYPMLKSSDIAKESIPRPSRWMLVTQRTIGKDTTSIKYTAPKTWAYLTSHSARLDKRQSSIYKGRPRFSIFGVGAYSFSPWKVAISGLYKKLHFAVVGPHAGKPVVLDDTCYFIPCQSEKEARYLAELLNSEAAKEFFKSFIFWDAKRPITANILKRLSLVALARELGARDRIMSFLAANGYSASPHKQLVLFEWEKAIRPQGYDGRVAAHQPIGVGVASAPEV
ncbi:MAG: SAM-dependent DNA methyltransferase [Chloroflexi bacterium]|nr:MAG: SAM-dependent DNA methyltransferase [Chloroflexota bacterium]